SQFSHEILNANPYAYLDDAPLEERRARAVEMRRVLPESVLEEVGKLDPAAIEQVREEAWPDVRDEDELHDVLHTLIALPAPTADAEKPLGGIAEPSSVPSLVGLALAPADPSTSSGQGVRAHVSVASSSWQGLFDRLVSSRRALGATVEANPYWIAAERAKTFATIYTGACFQTVAPQLEQVAPS